MRSALSDGNVMCGADVRTGRNGVVTVSWPDDVYLWTFIGKLGLGVLLFGFAGLVRLASGLADVMEEHRIHRLRPPVTTFEETAAKVGSADYRQDQSEIRDLIRDHGRWDAELGLYVVQMPESDRPVRGDGAVRYYAWARPP